MPILEQKYLLYSYLEYIALVTGMTRLKALSIIKSEP